MSQFTCMIVDDDAMSRAAIEHYAERHEALRLVASCADAIEAANVLQREHVDLIFLDVEMPEMSGLELVRSLDVRPQVVMITGKRDYAIEAFDVDVADYLLKPVEYPRFLKAVERAQRRVRRPRAGTGDVDTDTVFIKADGRLVKLDLRDVQHIEAQGDYVRISTNQKTYMVHSTMKAMAEKLPSPEFARVHRSYIVRIDQIKDIEDTNLVAAGSMIPIGASFKDDLMERLRLL